MNFTRENWFIIKFVLFLLAFLFTFFVLITMTDSINGKNETTNSVIYSETVFKHTEKMPVIIIDAGHGGEDGGAVSDEGILEKDINLDIAKKLEMLFKITDIGTAMTRTDDRLLYGVGQENRKKFYDINNRIKFAEGYEECILISIHQNKFPIKKYSGFQVYCSKNNPESKTLGEYLQNCVIKHLQPQNNRKIKIANDIMLLDNLKIPSVIAECGFLSNREEAELLCNDDYKNKIAFLIYAAVLQYFQ